MISEADVCELVREALHESTDWRLRELVAVTSHNRVYSSHYTLRVDCDDASPRLIFVKFVRGATDNRARLEQLVDRDHKVTRYLAGAFSEIPGVAIPTPIACSREHLMLITEFVEATRFQDKILRDARFPAAAAAVSMLAEECFRCGTWLQAFQGATQSYLEQTPAMGGDDVMGIETIVRLVTERLKGLHSKSVIDTANLQRLVAYVAEQAADVRPTELALVGVHGDFFPGNLMVRGETTIGIDFNMFRAGVAYFDATYFVYQLETIQAHPAYLAATINTLKGAFVRGYAPSQNSSDIWNWNPLCRILFVMHSTARLLKLVDATPSGIPRRLLNRASIGSTRRRLLRKTQAAKINK